MGACCWIVDPLTLIWNELLDSFKQKLGYIPIDKWQDVRQLWNGDYIRYFLNCGMNCLALGRLGNDFEEREETLKNGETKTKLVKVGTKFKAGGGESFGYEPHLLLELSVERSHWKQHELPNFCPQQSGQLSSHARKALRRMRQRPSLVIAFARQAELFPLRLYYAIVNSWRRRWLAADCRDPIPFRLYIRANRESRLETKNAVSTADCRSRL
jgi:hypothetical protein